jgi:hypothetical protein
MEEALDFAICGVGIGGAELRWLVEIRRHEFEDSAEGCPGGFSAGEARGQRLSARAVACGHGESGWKQAGLRGSRRRRDIERRRLWDRLMRRDILHRRLRPLPGSYGSAASARIPGDETLLDRFHRGFLAFPVFERGGEQENECG